VFVNDAEVSHYFICWLW